jgi:hypothetical protein
MDDAGTRRSGRRLCGDMQKRTGEVVYFSNGDMYVLVVGNGYDGFGRYYYSSERALKVAFAVKHHGKERLYVGQ